MEFSWKNSQYIEWFAYRRLDALPSEQILCLIFFLVFVFENFVCPKNFRFIPPSLLLACEIWLQKMHLKAYIIQQEYVEMHEMLVSNFDFELNSTLSYHSNGIFCRNPSKNGDANCTHMYHVNWMNSYVFFFNIHIYFRYFSWDMNAFPHQDWIGIVMKYETYERACLHSAYVKRRAG